MAHPFAIGESKCFVNNDGAFHSLYCFERTKPDKNGAVVNNEDISFVIVAIVASVAVDNGAIVTDDQDHHP